MSGLILPPGARKEEQGGVDSSIDLYDSDILRIEKVLDRLNAEDVGKPRDIESLMKKIIDLFHDIGLRVDVSVWTAADNRGQEVEGTYIPSITINGRVDSDHQFDYDRMVHEVTNDILELGHDGIINTKTMSQETKDLLAAHGGGRCTCH